jgi:peptidylprolyl isomerase
MSYLQKLLNFISIIFLTFNMATAKTNKNDNILYLQLKDGTVKIEMYPEIAPNHVKRIKELVTEGFYDGLKFHRVIDGFMAQTGDPKGNGTGGSGQNIKQEFSDLPHKRGAVSMARSANPDSADSQFFIVFDEASFLDGQYTVWGQVIDGMEFVDKIKKGNSANNGSVNNPDKIIKMSIK